MNKFSHTATESVPKQLESGVWKWTFSIGVGSEIRI